MKVCLSRVEEIKRLLKFDVCIGVDCQGRGGGLCMLSKDSVNVELNVFNQNFIDVVVDRGLSSSWRITCFYGFPERSRRRASWDLVFIVGDVNDFVLKIAGYLNHKLSMLFGQVGCSIVTMVLPLNLLDAEMIWLVGESHGLSDDDLMVKDLMTENGLSWVRAMLNGLFTEDEISVILSIPLPRFPCSDKLFWHFSKQGLYTVKSAYHVALSIVAICQFVGEPFQWQRLWNLLIPPKIKEFVWRVYHNVLPSKIRLIQKGLTMDPTCLFCSFEEDTLHVLLLCERAGAVWSYWDRNDLLQADSIRDLFVLVFNDADVSKQQQFCFLIWKLWSTRNLALWQGKTLAPTHVFHDAIECFLSWQESSSLRSNRMDNSVDAHQRISRFTAGFDNQVQWTAAVDGALFSSLGKSGFG
ncbi:hypothetical protein ACFE04_021456 [Oxalis oulophora]